MPATSDTRLRLAWVVPVVTYLTVAVLSVITAAVSYEHEYQLARRNGQVRWVSSLLPFTVDGMIFGAAVVLLWAGSQGIRRPGRPMAVLAVGVGATIAANLASGIGHGWLGAAVAAWSGLSLILMSDVAMWLTGAVRRLAGGEPVPQGRACSHPPPPVSLAEALPLARAELESRGQPHGQESLAAAFGVTRHLVRATLAAPGAALPADPAVADPHSPPAAATAGHLNGQAPGA